jgi:hypothetical protein
MGARHHVPAGDFMMDTPLWGALCMGVTLTMMVGVGRWKWRQKGMERR